VHAAGPGTCDRRQTADADGERRKRKNGKEKKYVFVFVRFPIYHITLLLLFAFGFALLRVIRTCERGDPWHGDRQVVDDKRERGGVQCSR